MQSPAPPASRQAKRAECRAAPEDFLLQHAQALPRDGGGPTALVLALATKVERDFKVEVLHSAPYTSAAAESSSPPLHAADLMLAELVAALLSLHSQSRSRCEMGKGA